MDTASKTHPPRLAGLPRLGERLWVLRRGSLSRRMLALAAATFLPLLLGGGLALDRVLADTLTRNFDDQLSQYVRSMIASAEIDPAGEVRFTRPLGDQRFFEPYSGLYWQVSGKGITPFRSRSLWDRALPYVPDKVNFDGTYRTVAVYSDETLRIAERDAVLPGSPRIFRFAVAVRVDELQAQIHAYRRVLVWSLVILASGLLILAALLATYGLWPLRRVQRALTEIRSGEASRIDEPSFPPEIRPLVHEMNALLAHTEVQSEQARTHAGNLAHALKTPMSVLLNEARGDDTPLGQAVLAQVALMKRHVDHHLARARALGRPAAIGARTPVWRSLESLKRALERIYVDKGVHIELVGDPELAFRGERQDLEEMLGNLLDNACKYGGQRVRVSVRLAPREDDEPFLTLTVEDDGQGIPASEWSKLFERGVRLDETSTGTGIGMAIVRDIAEIVGGKVWLERSADLGGLAVVVVLPAAE